MMPLLAESEKGSGQTESPFERKAEMWWVWMPKWKSQISLERETLEGDSPVDEIHMALLSFVIWRTSENLFSSKSRAPWIGGLNMAGLTANPKYNQSPIAQ